MSRTEGIVAGVRRKTDKMFRSLDIAPDLLPMPSSAAAVEQQPTPSDALQEAADSQQPSLEAVERNHILTLLEQTNWVIHGPRGAAQILDLHPNTLRNSMKKLGIARPAHLVW